MNIAIASDHAGYELKEDLKLLLKDLGHNFYDFGTHSLESVDYPDFGLSVAEAVSKGMYERGILVCATGIGMSMVANKVPGIRASLCHDLFTAMRSREHNDANILALGGQLIGKGLAREIVRVWLETSFGGGRHVRRVEKIRDIEKRYGGR